MIRTFLLCASSLIFVACGNKTKALSESEKQQYIQLGDSIATATQNALLQNVADAIQKGGTAYALDFCNEKAMPLTDSFSKMYKVNVQRISDKNRNPKNGLQSPSDSSVWQDFKKIIKSEVVKKDDGNLYYYKPIIIAMPACLKCHGGKADIDENTLQVLSQKYPLDKAKDYQMNELRGMWKIKINK